MSAVLIDSKALASVPRKRLPANLLSDYARRVEAGVFGNQKEKIDFVARFRTVLAEEEADWKRLQVSMVAGAPVYGPGTSIAVRIINSISMA